MRIDSAYISIYLYIDIQIYGYIYMEYYQARKSSNEMSLLRFESITLKAFCFNVSLKQSNRCVLVVHTYLSI